MSIKTVTAEQVVQETADIITGKRTVREVNENNKSEESIRQEALTVVERSKIVKIVDQNTYTDASILLLDVIMPLRRKWNNFWYGVDDGPVPLAYKAYKSVLGKFNEADKPLEDAEMRVKSAIGIWEEEQKRKQQELQREAERAARKAEEEARQNAAAVAEDSGASEEEVAAIVEAPILAVAQPVAPTYQKAAGISNRENYKARVTDIKKLCAAVAKGLVPVSYVEPNMTALNARAKADKLTMNVPGVVAYNDPIVAGRKK
jgi:hypothetical protein